MCWGDECRFAHRRVAAFHVEHLVLLVAPDVFNQFGKVDERVTVVLNVIHGIVAIVFLVAHGVVSAPFEQHVDGPGVERFPTAVVHHVGVLPLVVLVASGHIEIGAREVALVGIVGLEHGAVATALASHRGAHLGHAIVERGICHLAQRVVALSHIGLTVAWIEVVKVGVGVNFSSAPPTFWERVFLVHTTHALETIEVVNIVAIHIPHHAFVGRAAVGAWEVVPKAVVRHHSVILDEVVYRIFQRLPFQAVERAVISGRGSRKHRNANTKD